MDLYDVEDDRAVNTDESCMIELAGEESETGFRPGLDILLYGDELKEGYQVKREKPYSLAKDYEFARITKLRRYTTHQPAPFYSGFGTSEEHIAWVSVYPDGRQESENSSLHQAWIVSLASIQGEGC